MSEEEEILSNADASYGGTTDQESVISAESLVERQAVMEPVEEPMELLDEELNLDIEPEGGFLPKADSLPIAKISLGPLLPSLVPKPKSEDLLKAIPSTGNTKTTKELIAEVADNVHSCRVCYDPYHQELNQARILCCGHSFCTRCIVRCNQPVKNNFEKEFGVKCPECRKLSKQAPASLPINFQFMQLLTVLSLVKDVDAKPEVDEKYKDFEKLGELMTEDAMKDLTMEELQEHSRVLFNAMRLRGERDRLTLATPPLVNFYDAELRKLNEIERSIDKIVKNAARLKRGEVGILHEGFGFPQLRSLVHRHTRTLNNLPPAEEQAIPDQRILLNTSNNANLNNNDWMREMVVFRAPSTGDAPTPRTDQNTDLMIPIPPVQAEVEPDSILAVLEREAVAERVADPRRNLDAVREAHFRRERISAMQRDNQMRQERMMRELLNGEDEEDSNFRRAWQRIVEQNGEAEPPEEPEFEPEVEPEVEIERRSEAETEDSEASDDSSYMDELPEQAPPPPPPTLTIGELATIYQLIDTMSQRTVSIYPSGHRSQQSLLAELLPRHIPATEDATQEQMQHCRQYARLNKTDADMIVMLLRQHSVKYASNMVEAPRLSTRLRRRRAAPADEYNALLTVIRRRAKEALRGNSPRAPASEEECQLTLRLIVNIANSMGVRDSLESRLCPHRTPTPPAEDVFVARPDSSARHPTVFCTACRCVLPQAGQQSHAQGRRHLNNVQSRRPAASSSSR